MGVRSLERQVEAIVGVCRADLGAAELPHEVLRRLRMLVPADAAFFATVDPVTLLFTSAVTDEPLGSATAHFIDNEFGRADVNKFAALAADTRRVNSLDRATTGNRPASPRYREIMAPLSLGDELRAALVSAGRCWGVMCLHREDAPSGFTDRELRLVARLAPHLAEGLRRAILVEQAIADPAAEGPGIVLLDDDLGVVSSNSAGEFWLDELRFGRHRRAEELPLAVHAVAVQAAFGPRDQPPATAPRVRLQTAKGQWLVVHASRLRGAARPQTAIVVEPAAPSELASLILDAHGITPAQSRVAALVLQGRSTRQIVNELSISADTVQEHLGAVFDKFGVGSRRELVAALLSRSHA
jgi:DNA-binding CsgD family transcriptional regulator